MRDPATGNPAGYIHEALAACRDSGRRPLIAAIDPAGEVNLYLARHGLSELVLNAYIMKGSPEHERLSSDQLGATM